MNSSSAPNATQRVSRPLLARPACLGASLLLGLACLAPSPLPAASLKEDLARSTPVPADQPIPIVDFLRPARLGRPKLNPSGTHFAALFNTAENHDELLLVNLATGKKNLQAGQGGPNLQPDIQKLDWLSDTRLLYMMGVGSEIPMGLYSSEIDKPGAPLTLTRGSQIELLSRPLLDPTHPLLWIKRDASREGDDGGVVQIDATSTVEAQSRRSSLQAPVLTRYPQPPEGEAIKYLTRGDGNLAYAINTLEGAPYLWQWTGKAWTKCNLDLEKYYILGTADQPDEVIAAPLGEPGAGNTLVRLNTVTGATSEALVSDKDYGLTQAKLLRAENDGQVLGVSYSREKPARIWFDANAGALNARLEQLLPGVQSYELSRSSKAACSIIGASSDLLPEEYHLFDHASGKLTPLGKSRPWIAPERMQPMRCLSYVASDGLRIDARITLPKGATRQKPSPLIVLLDNGLSQHTDWGWNSQAQLFASRGYAVLQLSYRGTHMPGREFKTGSPLVLRRLQDDINDGVQFLVRSGVADPARIALLGEGSSAYLALGCATTEPGLYRCSVTVSGVFNWHKMLRRLKRYDSSSEQYKRAERGLGDPEKSRQQLEEISPLNQLSKLQGPVLVACRENPGTSVEESRDLVKALQKASRPFEKVLLEGSPTNKLLALENQVEIYTAIEGFLARNMPPLPAPERQAK